MASLCGFGRCSNEPGRLLEDLQNSSSGISADETLIYKVRLGVVQGHDSVFHLGISKESIAGTGMARASGPGIGG